MLEVDAQDPRVTEMDRQVTQWQRPANRETWLKELETLGQVPANVVEREGWVAAGAGLTLGGIGWALLALVFLPWWVGLVLSVLSVWAIRGILRGHREARALRRDPRQVRLSLLQEYPTHSMAFRNEVNDHPPLVVAYRQLRQTEVPILSGDVEQLRRIHGIEDIDDLGKAVLFMGGLFLAVGLGVLIGEPIAQALR